MTKPKSATSPPILILYGLDTDGRPRAACVQCCSGRPCQEGSRKPELQVLRIETAEQIELARQVPSGEILAPGRGNVPVVRKELFDKLLALVPRARQRSFTRGCLSCGGQFRTVCDHDGQFGPASKAPPPKQPPTTWAEIDVGDLVLAENWDPETGWYEAVVLEQVGDDELKLQFRDYPEEGTLVRRRNQLALLSPA